MLKSRQNLSRLGWTLLLSALMTHCGKTKFDKRNPIEAMAIGTGDSETKEPEDTQADDAVASEPVAIGGSFLSCALVPALATETLAAMQCEFSSVGHASGRAQDLAYKFSTGMSRASASPIAPTEQQFKSDMDRQLWSWTFTFMRGQIANNWLYIDIQDLARPLDPIINTDVAVPAPTALSSTTSPAGALTLFQFNSGPQKLGDEKAGESVEPGCGITDKDGIADSRRRRYTVTVSTETTLSLVFSNLCGVGTGQVNTTGSFTTASLIDSNDSPIFQFNLANQPKLSYASSKLMPGVYTLEINPASNSSGSLNDFVYSNLLIEGAGILVR